MLSFALLKATAPKEVSSPGFQTMVGMLLLVSAGSFLYVATIHILPEVYCKAANQTSKGELHSHQGHAHCDQTHQNKFVELSFVVAGLFTPEILHLLV